MGGQGLGRVPARAGVAMLFGTFQAMLPTSRETVKPMITGLSSTRALAPGCMAGYLWSSTARQPLEKNTLAGFIRPPGSDWRSRYRGVNGEVA